MKSDAVLYMPPWAARQLVSLKEETEDLKRQVKARDQEINGLRQIIKTGRYPQYA
jgi:predicted  nucleic acid-binding Zn-ribbon protein